MFPKSSHCQDGGGVWPLPGFFWRICPHALRALKGDHFSPKSDVSPQKCSLFPPKKLNKGILWVQKCGQIGQLIKILSKQRNCTFCREASLICYSWSGIMMIQCSHITSHRMIREVLTAHQRLLCWRGSRRTDSSCRLLLLSFSGDAHRWVTPIMVMAIQIFGLKFK